MTRVVTWNVRHCRGLDRRVAPERIIALLAALEPDIVALQEVDLHQPRSGAIDQADRIGAALGLDALFCRTLTCDPGEYGHALLTRLPVVSWESVPLPTPASSEPRSFIDARVSTGRAELRVCATHLSLRSGERRAQAKLIASRLAGAGPAIVLGDLNSGVGQSGYAQLARTLTDPLGGRRRTWPAILPLFALDHILVSPGVEIVYAGRCDAHGALYASDHRPILADVVVRADVKISSPACGSAASSDRSRRSLRTPPGPDRRGAASEAASTRPPGDRDRRPGSR